MTDTSYKLSSSLPTQVFKIFDNSPVTQSDFVRLIGGKDYELTDHLGNVRVVISDAKLIDDADADGLVTSGDDVTPEVRNYTDYYAFGMAMPGRVFNAGEYRYGFNGKEDVNELNGVGNSLDLGSRFYDCRIGRFLSIDPDLSEFSFMSGYCYAANRPIEYVDINGEGPGPRQGPAYRRPSLRNPYWLEMKLANERSNNNRGPRPRTQYPVRSGEPYPIIDYGETWSGKVKSRYPLTFSIRGTTYDALEAMQVVNKAIKQMIKFVEKKETVHDEEWNENTGAYYRPVTRTMIYVVIPDEVMQVEELYRNKVKMQAQGNLSEEEFNRLPISDQERRYNVAKFVVGPSPRDKYIEMAKKAYENEENSTSADNGSQPAANSSPSNGAQNSPSNSSGSMQSAPTYNQ